MDPVYHLLTCFEASPALMFHLSLQCFLHNLLVPLTIAFRPAQANQKYVSYLHVSTLGFGANVQTLVFPANFKIFPGDKVPFETIVGFTDFLCEGPVVEENSPASYAVLCEIMDASFVI